MLKIIISPAKAIQVQEIENEVNYSIPSFLKETNQLASKLKQMSVNQIGEMMHLSNDLAQLNFDRYQSFEMPESKKESNFPAILGFNGEVYKGINIATLDKKYYQALQSNLRILSGLYGLLKPFDLMYPYRLEMGTKWQITPKTKGLYQFWGDKLVNSLNDEMGKDEVLINLASNEYSKAVPFKKLNHRVITPHFKDFKNGKLKVVMMYAKHQRGAMARYIIENDIQNVEQLKLYNLDGYSFDANSSTETDWVFVR
ncbi:MAG: peroxide stress protein YaaA [Crocinitomicaceae bacterium]